MSGEQENRISSSPTVCSFHKYTFIWPNHVCLRLSVLPVYLLTYTLYRLFFSLSLALSLSMSLTMSKSSFSLSARFKLHTLWNTNQAPSRARVGSALALHIALFRVSSLLYGTVPALSAFSMVKTWKLKLFLREHTNKLHNVNNNNQKRPDVVSIIAPPPPILLPVYHPSNLFFLLF